MNQNSIDESNDFGDADALLQVEASMVRQGQQGTPCTQIHAAAGHALHAMASVLALASTQMGGEKL